MINNQSLITFLNQWVAFKHPTGSLKPNDFCVLGDYEEYSILYKPVENSSITNATHERI